MNIQFDKTTNVSAELTISIEKADYQERVEKALKDYRKKAQLPGFRPGQVPLSLLKKRFGEDITAEEVQKLLSEKLYGYLRENKVNMLGEPMASDKQQPLDFAAEKMDFVFDIALAPEFDATLSDKDEVPFYLIEVTDEMVEAYVKAYTQQAGHYDKVEAWQAGDMTKGHIAELDEDGNIKENGIVKEDAVMLPDYFKSDEQKKKFEGVGANTVITFNPYEAYDGSDVEISSLLGITKEEAKNVKGNFSYQITEITRYTPAELNQELFDQVLGEGVVSSETEFRAHIKEQIQQQYVRNSEYRLLIDVRKYLEKRIGDLEWPEELLKRIMRANNPDKDDDYIEKNYALTIKETEWHLIKEQLSDQTKIEVVQADVLEMAKEQTRNQFSKYGMGNIPEDIIERYANEQMQNRERLNDLVTLTLERKLSTALKDVVKLQTKSISMDDFNKLFETE